MNPITLQIFQEILLAVDALQAAQPYLDKLVAMNEAGATGEDMLAATQEMRKQSGAKLDADLAAAP